MEQGRQVLLALRGLHGDGAGAGQADIVRAGQDDGLPEERAAHRALQLLFHGRRRVHGDGSGGSLPTPPGALLLLLQHSAGADSSAGPGRGAGSPGTPPGLARRRVMGAALWGREEAGGAPGSE